MKALGDKFVEPFSSPIGESTFSTFLIKYYGAGCGQFSSPIGESTFSTLSAVNVHKFGDTVFVPYRGIYFLYTNIDGEPWFNATRFRPLSGNLLSLQDTDEITEHIKSVFVPYRGIYFLYGRMGNGYIFGRMFSSPIGESTFSTDD